MTACLRNQIRRPGAKNPCLAVRRSHIQVPGSETVFREDVCGFPRSLHENSEIVQSVPELGSIESLHPPGDTMTAAVLKDTIKGTPCTSTQATTTSTSTPIQYSRIMQ